MRWYWFDRYTEFVSGKMAKAVKCISLAEDHIHDHFYAYPLMPNSLIVEGVAQTAGILACEYGHYMQKVVLAKIIKAVFYLEARPGNILTYTTYLERIDDQGVVVRATSHLGDDLQGEFEMMFALLDDAFKDKTLFTAEDYHKLVFSLGVYDIGVDQDGNRLTVPENLLV